MITQKQLKDMLDYNPDTGEFKWKVRAAYKIKVGDKAGCLSKVGYWQIGILGRTYSASNLAWLYMTGKMPKEIDHKDHDPTNNKFDNLRKCTRTKNQQHRKPFKRSKFNLPKGVTPSGKKYKASIVINRKAYYLGQYDTPEEASLAYEKEAKKRFGKYYKK